MPARLFDSRDDAIRAFAEHVSRGKADFFRGVGLDLVMGRREGCHFWDVDGRRFLNAHSNGGVFNMGHRHPDLVTTLRHALDDWDIGNHHLISEARAKLATRLGDMLPGDIDKVVFAVGGGEAVDTALKMARGLTGRPGVISARGGYHGHTGLAMATGDAKYREPFGPQLPGFSQVPFGDLEALDAAVDETCAAVILEAVPATLGIVVPDAEYMRGVRDLCDARGALFVLDEVQTGLGRTGRMFACEHWGVVPDFVVLGKGLSGGLVPISATCFRAEHERIFAPDPFVHISTFGGAELACLVSLRMLDLVSDATFLTRVAENGADLAARLATISADHAELVAGPRHLGMMAGLEWRSEGLGLLASKALFDAGVFAVYSNNDRRVTQLLLPLIAGTAELDELGRGIDAAATALASEESRQLAAALDGA
ncbi:MAG: aspartate aminotransferase family protein [Acidimicrobiia bacterium]|nr:aspartate aminotransferase family protein [Acidimicrobiia bacterium]